MFLFVNYWTFLTIYDCYDHYWTILTQLWTWSNLIENDRKWSSGIDDRFCPLWSILSVMFANVRYCSLMIDFELTVWSKSFKFVQNRTYCSVVNVQSSTSVHNRLYPYPSYDCSCNCLVNCFFFIRVFRDWLNSTKEIVVLKKNKITRAISNYIICSIPILFRFEILDCIVFFGSNLYYASINQKKEQIIHKTKHNNFDHTSIKKHGCFLYIWLAGARFAR